MNLVPRLKKVFQPWYSVLLTFGWDPRLTLLSLRGLPAFLRDLFRFCKMRAVEPAKWPMSFSFPILSDRFLPAGTMRGHYFLQDLHVAQRIFRANPSRHVDVGSSLAGFVAHVAAFRPIEVFDVRPAAIDIPNLKFRQVDLMDLPEHFTGYTDSASCLHVLEHLGLGRYGDTIDPGGHCKGVASLARLVHPGGTLYLSVPIGPQRIEFNAQRVFSVTTILALCQPWFQLARFSFIDDESRLHRDVDLTPAALATDLGTHLGCGIFELTRLGNTPKPCAPISPTSQE